MPSPPHSTLVLCALSGRRPGAIAARFPVPRGAVVRLLRHPDPDAERARAVLRPGELWLLVPDPYLSARHAALRPAPEGLRLEDLGSANGTRLQGARLTHTSRPLRHGDLITTGRTLWCHLLTPDSAAESAAADAPLRPAPALPPTLNDATRRTLCALLRLGAAGLPLLLLGEPGTHKLRLLHAVQDLYRQSGHGGPLTLVAPGAALPPLPRRGTLLIHDLDRLSRDDQRALLRVLRRQTQAPAAAASPLRLLASCDQLPDAPGAAAGATHLPDLLPELMLELSPMTLVVPPLRERPEDVLLLCEDSLTQLGAALGLPDAAAALERLPLPVAERLLSYGWPGNQAELMDVTRRGLLRALGVAVAEPESGAAPSLTLTLPPPEATPTPASVTPVSSGAAPDSSSVAIDNRGAEAAPSAERAADPRQRLIAALRAEEGQVTRAALRLGLSRVHVHRLARQLGVDPATFRPPLRRLR